MAKPVEQVRAQFSEPAIADLTLAIVAINGWNRVSIGFRTEPGTYQPRAAHARLKQVGEHAEAPGMR